MGVRLEMVVVLVLVGRGWDVPMRYGRVFECSDEIRESWTTNWREKL